MNMRLFHLIQDNSVIVEMIALWTGHYSDVIMGAMASQITNLTIV